MTAPGPTARTRADLPPGTGQPGTVPPPTGDWPAQAADAIEKAVGTVRDKTTGPAITVGRLVVYGTFATIVGIAVLTLVTIGAVRAIDVYLPSSVFGDERTWAAHLLVGLVFTGAGMVAWSRRPRSGG